MSFEMECPNCGEGIIEVEEVSYHAATPDTRDYPGDPAELEFSIIRFCELCGVSEQNILEDQKMYDKVLEEAFDKHVEPEDPREWEPEDEWE